MIKTKKAKLCTLSAVAFCTGLGLSGVAEAHGGHGGGHHGGGHHGGHHSHHHSHTHTHTGYHHHGGHGYHHGGYGYHHGGYYGGRYYGGYYGGGWGPGWAGYGCRVVQSCNAWHCWNHRVCN